MQVGTFKMWLICDECSNDRMRLSEHVVIPGQGDQPDTFICHGPCRTFKTAEVLKNLSWGAWEEDSWHPLMVRETDNLTVTKGWHHEEQEDEFP